VEEGNSEMQASHDGASRKGTAVTDNIESSKKFRVFSDMKFV
jgi:hypothetical protein